MKEGGGRGRGGRERERKEEEKNHCDLQRGHMHKALNSKKIWGSRRGEEPFLSIIMLF